jgi:hypothetical protein
VRHNDADAQSELNRYRLKGNFRAIAPAGAFLPRRLNGWRRSVSDRDEDCIVKWLLNRSNRNLNEIGGVLNGSTIAIGE